MNATALKFENNLLDLVTAVIMAPVAASYSLVWLIWQGCVLLWPYRKHIGLALAFAGVVALFVAFPLLPLGLAITGAVGYATYPRSAVQSC